jgi:hypothetical protein
MLMLLIPRLLLMSMLMLRLIPRLMSRLTVSRPR